MKIKKKGLITVAVALLMLAVIVPVYAQSQSGTLQHLRTQDPDCEHQGPATRAYGEDPPVQAQEEKPEGLSGEETGDGETPIQEQTQTQEQLREGDCENADCEENQYQYQYQYQYQFQEQCQYGQEED